MNLASLFNLQGPDLFVILIIVLLLFGARKFPELAQALRRAMREFLGTGDEFERQLGDREQQAVPEGKYRAINRVLLIIAGLAGLILLSVLLSDE